MKKNISGIIILLFYFVATTHYTYANDKSWEYKDWNVNTHDKFVRYMTNGDTVHGHQFGFIKMIENCNTDLLWISWSTYEDGIDAFKGSDAIIQLRIGETQIQIDVTILSVKNLAHTLKVIGFSNFVAGEKLIQLLNKEQKVEVTIIAPEALVSKLDISTDTFSLSGFRPSMLKAKEFCEGSNVTKIDLEATSPPYHVSEKAGDLYLKAANKEVRLTYTGLNKSPVIHPSGEWIYYIKTTEANPDNGDMGSVDPPKGYMGSYVFKEEIWKMKMSGESKSFVYKSPKPPEANQTWYTLSSIDNIKFSPSGDKLYFQSDPYTVTGTMWGMDSNGSNAQCMSSGYSYRIIKSNTDGTDNKYKGYLIIKQHRYFTFGGSYEWWWLFDPDFKEIGPIGDNLPNDISFIDQTVWSPFSGKTITHKGKQKKDKASTYQLNTSEWSINESEGRVNLLYANKIDRNYRSNKIEPGLMQMWAYLYPTQYGDSPRVSLSFRTLGGEGVSQFSMDEIHNENRDQTKLKLKHIGMRPMKVNDKWIKMDVYGALRGTTGTIYTPYTMGDLNELLCIFINSTEVTFNGATFSTKGFIKTFEQYNEMLNYSTIMIDHCKDPSGRWILKKIKKN